MFRKTKEWSRSLVLLIVMASMFSGCASLGGKITVPESPEEKLAFAEATLTGLTLAAVQLNNAELITLEKAKEIESIISKTELAIRLGRVALNGKDADTALKQLICIQDFLLELNSYVESKRNEYLTRPLPPIPVKGDPVPIEEEPS